MPIFLNCLETGTIPLNSLLRYFEEILFACKLACPNLTCIELKEFLEKEFSVPCQVKDVIQKLKMYRKFTFTDKIEVTDKTYENMLIPHEPNKLVELLMRLHTQKDIILLMPFSSDRTSWWIINKGMQNVLLSEVNSIFSPVDFDNAPNLSSAHNTGVIPSSKLSEIFKSLPLTIDVIENYLLCMGYCEVIEEKEVLNLIIGHEEMDDDKYFFFPGLIKGDRQIFSFPQSDPNAYHCGWQLECQQDLGLRFLHSLLLRLTFKFSRESGDSKYSKRLSLWKYGMFWCTQSGINVLVEVQQDRRVLVLFRCRSDKGLPLVKLRSEVIGEIHEVLSKNVEATEYYLYPPPTDFNSYEQFLSEHDVRRPLVDLKKAFKEEPDSRSIDINNTEVASLSDILGFDSYVSLEKSTLSLLKGSDQTLKDCFDHLQLSIDNTKLKQILDVRAVDSTIHEKWLLKHDIKPLQQLCAQLDKYSAFKLSDLHVI